MDDLKEKSLAYHARARGKTALAPTVPLASRDDLALCYTPGVAWPCREIARDPSLVNTYTAKGHTIAIVSDGTAILGLGDIGPEAGLPVMEGKALLFKKFAALDAVPLMIATHDPQEIIRFCELIAPTFAGINLEDISFPRCVEIEETLRSRLSIPVFHDDQRGTATVVAAALHNALRLVGKTLANVRIVVSGLGAAGSAIATMLHGFGAREITATNRSGIISLSNPATKEEAKRYITRGVLHDAGYDPQDNTLSRLMRGADVVIGVSVAGLITPDMIDSMAEKPIVFALANPDPEITREDASRAKTAVYASGRSDEVNQINNVLVFPGIFKGALAAGAHDITDEMTRAASLALASLIAPEDLTPTHIIPSILDPRTTEAVASAAASAAANAAAQSAPERSSHAQ